MALGTEVLRGGVFLVAQIAIKFRPVVRGIVRVRVQILCRLSHFLKAPVTGKTLLRCKLFWSGCQMTINAGQFRIFFVFTQ